MSFLFIVVFLLIIIVGWFWIARERKLATRSGMSEDHPVCGECLYALGGWSSPICPECGKDVTEIGVRTGPSSLTRVLITLWLVVCLGLIAPMVIGLLQLPLGLHVENAHLSRHHRDSHVSMLVETDQVRRIFPPSNRHTTAVVLTYRPDVTRGSWRNGRFIGTGGVEREFAYDEDGTPPSAAALDEAFRDIAGTRVAPDQRSAFVAELETVITTLEANRDKPGLLSLLQGLPTPAFGTSGGAGGSRSVRPSRLAMPIGLAAAALTFWLGARTIGRRCRPGWREVRDGEWTQVRRGSE